MQWIKKIVLVLGASLTLVTGAMAQQQFVNVLTGGQSGVYYPWVWLCRKFMPSHSQCAPPPR
jgi:TRAP-type uncharacterized transport system substrate-binding protein